MMGILFAVLGLISVLYVGLVFISVYVVHQFPRNPVSDRPDWGSVRDEIIPAQNGGFLEVWRIEPEDKSKGIILFAHGWGPHGGQGQFIR